MKTSRRIAAAVGCAIAVVAPGAATGAQPAPPSTVPATALLAPNAEPGDVVHSWALAPAFNDLGQGGNRSNLSFEVPPGTEFSDQVTLFNLGNVPLTFRVYPTDAFNTDAGSYELLRRDQVPTDVGSWVTLPQDTILLPAKTQVTMPVNIRVPITATPGDHAGGILASSEAQSEAPDGKIIGVDRRTSVRLYVRVAGAVAPKLTVEKLATTYRPGFNPLDGTAEVTYRIENRGNVRTGGRQRVSVSGPFGLARKQKAAMDIPELLPGQGATMTATFRGVAASGLEVTRVRLSPALVGGASLKSGAWTARTVAPPVVLLAAILVAGLLHFARRAYLRRRDAAVGPELPVR